MPKEPKIPKVSYKYVEDESAVNAVFDMLFDKLLQQKAKQMLDTKPDKVKRSREKPKT